MSGLASSRSNVLPALISMDAADTANRIWCSKCGMFRDSECFATNNSGRRKKLCNRHGKKRELEETFDDWDSFEAKLHAWNHPVYF